MSSQKYIDLVNSFLDNLIQNTSSSNTEVRCLINAIRKSIASFQGAPGFDTWIESFVKDLLSTKESFAMVFNISDLYSREKLEELEHVGPPSLNSPTFRKWVKEEDSRSLNPTEDFRGTDEESHYCAPHLFKQIQKDKE